MNEKVKCALCGSKKDTIAEKGSFGMAYIMCDSCGAMVTFRGHEELHDLVDTYNKYTNK